MGSLDFSCFFFLSIFEEAFAGLAAEQAGTDHLAEQRVRTILGIAELFVENFHDGEVDVVADEVGQGQRSHGVVGAELHAFVDVFSAGDAVGEDADSLVDHGDKDAVDDEAGGFLHFDGLLADAGGEVDDALADLVAGELSADDLDEGHAVGGVEEVHADELSRTAGAGCNLGDAQRAAVGGEDGFGFADFVEFGEDILLELHLLDGGLDDEVGVGEGGIVGGGGDVGEQGVDGLLGHLAFLDEFAVAFGDGGHGLVKAGLGAAFHYDGHLGGKGFDNAFCHSAGSNNVDFHDKLLFDCLIV